MKKLRFSVIMMFIVCIIVPRAFPVEISKDTAFVNDSYVCFNSSGGMDTLKLWNTANSPVKLDTFEIIMYPSQDGLFRVRKGSQTLSIATVMEKIEINFYTSYQDSFIWIDMAPINSFGEEPPVNNTFRVPASHFLDTVITSFLSFNAADTCFIYGIRITDCFGCVGAPTYYIDFSAQINLYYSDGSRVSFHCIKNYTVGVERRSEYRFPNKVNMPDNGMFNIRGQMLHRSIGMSSPGIYLRTTRNGHIESRVLKLNPTFDGNLADAP